MKIVLSANSSWYIFNFRSNLIRSLKDLGHEIHVIAPEDHFSDKLQNLGVSFHSLPLQARSTSPLREIWSILTLGKTLSKIKPDNVLSFTIKSNLYTGLISYFVNYQLIANVSGLGEAFDKRGLLNKIVRILYRLSLKNAQRIFFQNNDDLEYCINEKLVPSEKSQVIPGSGVDLKTFFPIKKLSNEESKIEEKKIFLMLGRLLPQKGYHYFLDAVAILKSRHPENPLFVKSEFWILGIPDKRKESQELYLRVQQASRDGYIEYLQPTADVVPIIQRADVIVLPTLYNEGVPRILLEALACGKPAITTNWRGCKDAILHGYNGYLIEPKELTAEELANRMEKFILMGSEEYQQLSENSRFIAETKFDEQLVIERYQNELAKISSL
ncbi:MAG: glycosyltransferase family 4 protein [Proteobacteria bacterium]|nr:glycosyltransferase family 4 protein [Pseudomonadota bacterium]